MRKFAFLLAVLMILTFQLGPLTHARADVVGHFLKVEGQVDLLKQGKLPPKNPKVQEGVEPGDVIQTKTQGRAQVKFVDDSVLTIAPGSRVAIETYMYDGAKGSRKAVLQVFSGLVQAVVSRIFNNQEPDFIMKTHTAVLGVRGTKWCALLGPNGTDVFNELGRLCVRNINSEIKGEVCLNPLERTRVMPDLAPLDSMPFQLQDLAPLNQQLNGDGDGSGGGGGGGSPGSGSASGPGSSGGLPPPGSSGGVSPSDLLSQNPFLPLPQVPPTLPPTESGIKQWVGTSGWWNDTGLSPGASNWYTIGVPQSGDIVYLTQNDSINRTVTYTNTTPVLLTELRIDATGTGSMNLQQVNSSYLTVNNEYVGYDGRGTFNQSGGVNTVNNLLVLADNPGSSGTYNLQGGSLTAATINLNPGGIFNQTGGTLMAGGLNNAGTMALTGGSSTVIGEVTNQPSGQINLANNPTFTGNVTNYGTVRTSNTTVTWSGSFINGGAYISDPATQSFTDLTIIPPGYLVGGAKDQFIISNDFINQSVMNLSWNTVAADLAFTLGADNQHNLYVPGADLGPGRSGFQNNFAWGKLDLTGQSLTLYDGNSQAGGALYVGEIILGYTPEGLLLATITGNGLNIYYDPDLNAYLGGLTYELLDGGYLMPLNPVPAPPSAWLFLSGLAALVLGRLCRGQRD